MNLSLADKVSLSRIPLTIFFILFINNKVLLLIILAFVIISDILDGYLARRNKNTTKFGASLDPLMDKIFIVTAFIIFLINNSITTLQFIFLIIRDVYSISEMILIPLLKNNKFHKASLFGKITTSLHFLLITMLILNIKFTGIVVILVLISSIITIFGYVKSRWLK